MKTKTPRFVRALAALLFAAVLPIVIHAGPPLICHPYSIGDAQSLPGGNKDHFGLSASYDRTNVVRDTLALLTPDMPVIVRMETLRRAALYATNEMSAWRHNQASYSDTDRALALGLLQQLRERTQTAVVASRPLALFDLGFYVETLRQAHLETKIDGYELLTKVAELRPNDPDVQFALALASTSPKRKEHSAYLASAAAGAKPDTLLASNLRTHFSK